MDPKGIILGLYVDDLVYAARKRKTLEEFEEVLKAEFDLKFLGEASMILGIKIVRNRAERTIHLSQAHYVRDLLTEYRMTDANRVRTPMLKGSMILLANGSDAKTDITEYQRLTGKLMHLSQTTRMDLSFLTGRLSQHMADPRVGHYQAAKHSLRYLNGTIDLGLVYGRDPAGHKEKYQDMGLIGYSDSDYAGDMDNRRSTMGYVYCLNGAAVSWSSKRARTVSCSSTEAEYVALGHVAKQAIWIKRLLNDMVVLGHTTTVRLVGDNTSSLKMIKNDEFHSRTKHIDVQHHFIRELTERKEISIEYTPTKDMLADDFTKSLPAPVFEEHRMLMGMADPE